MKHTGQESGNEMCKIFIFLSFLQSKSVNNDCFSFSPRPPSRASPLEPTDIRPHAPWAIIHLLRKLAADTAHTTNTTTQKIYRNKILKTG